MTAIRSASIFAAVFALVYVVCVEMNWAAFTYHPRENIWKWGVSPAAARNAPAMYWYGWMASAFAVAALATLVAVPLARRGVAPVWIGWAVPTLAMLSFFWFLRMFFFR